MLRIVILVGLILASASQGFAHKVGVWPDPVQSAQSIEAVEVFPGENAEPSEVPDNSVGEAKSTYCQFDCKGVIAASIIVPAKSSPVPDGAGGIRHHSIFEPLDPRPPET